MNRKAFTLIELLAVIVIIAVIFAIAVPIVNNIIESAKLESVKRTVDSISNAALTKCQTDALSSNETVNLYEVTNGVFGSEKLSLSGKLPNKATIRVNNKCEVAISSYSSGYCVIKDYTSNNFLSLKSTESTCVLPEEYALLTCNSENKENCDVRYTYDTTNTAINLEPSTIVINNISWPEGIYYPGDQINISVDINVVRSSDFRISLRYLDSNYNWVMQNIDEYGLSVGNHIFTYSWTVNETFSRGFYGAAVQIMEMAGDWTVSRRDITNAFYVSTYAKDEWHYLTASEYHSVNGTVAGGVLNSDNTTFQDSKITVTLPANQVTGGQFYTSPSVDTYTYGVYEARIKVPDNKASLSSIFLYSSEINNQRYEIDLEFYNTLKWGVDNWKVDFTIFDSTHESYAYYHNIVLNSNPDALDGAVYQKTALLPSGFDLVNTFHNYKIVFNMNCISFYIDDILYGYWDDTFDYNTNNLLYLMGGSFFPTWLGQNASDKTTNMEIEWIRYKIYN